MAAVTLELKKRAKQIKSVYIARTAVTWELFSFHVTADVCLARFFSSSVTAVYKYFERILTRPKSWGGVIWYGWSSKIAQNVPKMLGTLLENSDHTEINQALETTLLSICSWSCPKMAWYGRRCWSLTAVPENITYMLGSTLFPSGTCSSMFQDHPHDSERFRLLVLRPHVKRSEISSSFVRFLTLSKSRKINGCGPRHHPPLP